MSNNRTFWKALHSLTHPLSIIAILLLLFNDHWLRHTYPSWLTGKLGDFTWLLFAPFIAAMLFALIIPRKIENHSKIVGILSIAFIGIWFATTKTIPAIHWLTTETLSAIVGYRGTLRMDVSDLLTLPALLISWHIWQTLSETKVNLKPVAYVAFGLAMLGTMASDGAYYEYTYTAYSIETICELDDGRLLTNSTIDVDVESIGNPDEFQRQHGIPSDHTEVTNYISNNGGLNWLEVEGVFENKRCSSPDGQTAIHQIDENIQYRWMREHSIEQSLDGGATWTRIHNLPELKQDARSYSNQNPQPIYRPLSSYNSNSQIPPPSYLASPVSGIVHSETGNLILSMSTNGVMVITSDGESNWIAVGNYQLDNLFDKQLIQKILGWHHVLLPTLWFLILVSTIIISHSKMWLMRLWIIAGWISWLFLVITAHYTTPYANIPYDDFGGLWALIAFSSMVSIGIPMSLWAFYHLALHYRQAFLPILVSAILASAGYLFPLLLWTQGTIPRYYVASIFSILLTGCVLWACYVYFKDKLPARYEPPKGKRKPKEA